MRVACAACRNTRTVEGLAFSRDCGDEYGMYVYTGEATYHLIDVRLWRSANHDRAGLLRARSLARLEEHRGSRRSSVVSQHITNSFCPILHQERNPHSKTTQLQRCCNARSSPQLPTPSNQCPAIPLPDQAFELIHARSTRTLCRSCFHRASPRTPSCTTDRPPAHRSRTSTASRTAQCRSASPA